MKKSTEYDTYPLEVVMSYSVMAYNMNGRYVNLDVTKQNFSKCSETSDTNPKVTTYSNKNIMLNGMGIKQIQPGKDEEFKFENVPDEDEVQTAKDIITYYQGLMLKAISGKINDFEEKVLEIVKQGEVANFNFGVIASLPKSYFRSMDREKVEQKQRLLSDDSEYIGTVGEQIKTDITVMRTNYIAKLGCHVVNAIDKQKNLVVFFTSKGEVFNITDKDISVVGKVKRHQTSSYHSGKETVLNYVKVN